MIELTVFSCLLVQPALSRRVSFVWCMYVCWTMPPKDPVSYTELIQYKIINFVMRTFTLVSRSNKASPRLHSRKKILSNFFFKLLKCNPRSLEQSVAGDPINWRSTVIFLYFRNSFQKLHGLVILSEFHHILFPKVIPQQCVLIFNIMSTTTLVRLTNVRWIPTALNKEPVAWLLSNTKLDINVFDLIRWLKRKTVTKIQWIRFHHLKKLLSVSRLLCRQFTFFSQFSAHGNKHIKETPGYWNKHIS